MKNFYKLLVSNILFFMILIVIAIMLSGCSKKYAEKELSKGGAIANVLGCMFAPDTCPKKDKSTEANTEEDNKEWDEVK
tara:strand:- start:1925 stop:2161 length:237 start_codon:yes stop_codon:yes gene_type:complete